MDICLYDYDYVLSLFPRQSNSFVIEPLNGTICEACKIDSLL